MFLELKKKPSNKGMEIKWICFVKIPIYVLTILRILIYKDFYKRFYFSKTLKNLNLENFE